MNKLLLILTLSALISGCFDGDDDAPVNTPPVASDSVVITQTEQTVEGNLVAVDNDADDVLTFALNAPTQFGDVSVAPNGRFTYTPQNEYTGDDSFTFTVTDRSGASASGTVSITVEVLTVEFAALVRDAFGQAPTAEPIRLNGRNIVDNTSGNEFDDLLSQ